MFFSLRSLYVMQLLTIVFILLISLYLQYYKSMLPCPLCIMQRGCFVLLGISFFIGIFAKPLGRQIINIFSILFSFAGLFFASRQIWIQYFPTTNSNECGVTIQYMLQVLPLHEVAQKIFAGGAECTERGVNFLFLNMAEWSLLLFIIFLLANLFSFKKINSI